MDSDGWIVIGVVLLLVLFAGDPDIHDAIIAKINGVPTIQLEECE